jgi:hypothetical protein
VSSGEGGFFQGFPGGWVDADGSGGGGGGGGNKAGRFVQVGIFVEGGRKGVIWIPEGRNGRGWRRFAGELQLLISSKLKGLDLEATLAPSSASLFTGLSFVEVIREVPGVEGRIS